MMFSQLLLALDQHLAQHLLSVVVATFRQQGQRQVVTSGQCVGVVRSKLPFAINQDGPEQLLGVLEFTTSLQHVGQAMTGGQAGPV